MNQTILLFPCEKRGYRQDQRHSWSHVLPPFHDRAFDDEAPPASGGQRIYPLGIFRFPVLPQIGNKQPENAAFEIGTPGNEKAVSTGCRRCSLSTTKTRKKHRQSVAILSSWINAIPFSLTFLRMGNEVKD